MSNPICTFKDLQNLSLQLHNMPFELPENLVLTLKLPQHDYLQLMMDIAIWQKPNPMAYVQIAEEGFKYMGIHYKFEKLLPQ